MRRLWARAVFANGMRPSLAHWRPRKNGLFNLSREWWYDRRPVVVMEKMECQP